MARAACGNKARWRMNNPPPSSDGQTQCVRLRRAGPTVVGQHSLPTCSTYSRSDAAHALSTGPNVDTPSGGLRRGVDTGKW
eukprot:7228454-Prymnesium_polylepis.1